MKQITAVGIDVSKGWSMVAVRQPGGVIVAAPFKINHTATELNQLIQMLHQYPSEVRIVMEHTGAYWRPVALALVNAGFYVSVVNAMLVHDFHDNSLEYRQQIEITFLVVSICCIPATLSRPKVQRFTNFIVYKKSKIHINQHFLHSHYMDLRVLYFNQIDKISSPCS